MAVNVEESDPPNRETVSKTSSPPYSAIVAYVAIPPNTLSDPKTVEEALSTFDYFGGHWVLDGGMALCENALRHFPILSPTSEASQWMRLQVTAYYMRWSAMVNMTILINPERSLNLLAQLQILILACMHRCFMGLLGSMKLIMIAFYL